MPLLRRKPFTAQKPPPNLQPDDEVFICKHTNELFRDYEELYNRSILCNSLVWTCEYTGKANLTYQEAIESEDDAKQQLKKLNQGLQRAILTLVHNTQRGRLANLCDELLSYLRDRFQVGEEVEVHHGGKKKLAEIVKVIEPQAKLTNGVSNHKPAEGSNGTSKSPHKSSDNAECQSPSKKQAEVEESSSTPKSPKLKSPTPMSPTLKSPNKTKPADVLISPFQQDKSLWPDSKHYKYEIKFISRKRDRKLKEKPTESETLIVKASVVGRKRGVFSKDRLKLFLRTTCERSTPQSDEGYWMLKNEFVKKFDLGQPHFQGCLPFKSPSRSKKKRKSSTIDGGTGDPPKKKRKSSDSKKKLSEGGAETKKRKDKKTKDEGVQTISKPKLTMEEIQRMKEVKKQCLEEEKARKKEEREVERALKKLERDQERDRLREERKVELNKMKEEKRLEAIKLREEKRLENIKWMEWKRPREDLELDDLEDLPAPTPLEMKVPSNLFGDMVMVVEFLNIYAELFDVTEQFPDGITLAMLEESLSEHDAEGVFYDLLKFLLENVLKINKEEEEEEGLETSGGIDVRDDDEEDTSPHAVVSASAAMALTWPVNTQGVQLTELAIDQFTVTEVLRLHLLSTGARIGVGESGEYRWMRRGGFVFSDDPGVDFRHKETEIMKALITGNVYDLNAEEKLKVFTTLVNQLLTFALTRDYVDEGFHRLKQGRREYQSEQWADQRREREEATIRYKRRLEEKAKLKEKEEREKKAKEEEANKGGEGNQLVDGQGTSSEAVPDPPIQDTEENKAEEEVKKDTKKKGKKKNEVVEPEETRECKLMKMNDEEFDAAIKERCEDFKKKEQDFIEEIRTATSMSCIHPLGRDRMYRRFWTFRYVKGLFVEDDDPESYKSLTWPESDESEYESEEEEEEEQMDVVDKDNKTSENENTSAESKQESQDSNVTPQQNGTVEVNGESVTQESANSSIVDMEIGDSGNSSEQDEEIVKKDLSEVYDKYRERQVVHWGYYQSKEELESLLSSLNTRGLRECNLRDALRAEYHNICTAIEECPLKQSLNVVKREGHPKSRRSRNQTVDKSLYKVMEDFVEANLRDQILDLEDRLWQGSLGILKVEDRETWRHNLENSIYEGPIYNKEDNSMNGSVVEDVKVNGQKEAENGTVNGQKETENETVNGETGEREDSMDIDGPESDNVVADKEVEELSRPQTLVLSAIPEHVTNSGRSTPSGTQGLCPESPQSRAGTPICLPANIHINPAVRDLTLALLKVEQGIEWKYLTSPLGDDEDTKKKKQKEAMDAAKSEFDEMMANSKKGKKPDKGKGKEKEKEKEKEKGKEKKKKEGDKTDHESEEEEVESNSSTVSESDVKPQKTPLERWEESLMSCTSLSQIFVHLNTLDRSIVWNKSVLNARCRLCKRKGDAEHMLLCDGCDRGHHMYCLKPPIKQIPDGDWYCQDCRPKEPRRSYRRPVVQESDDEEEKADSDEEEEEEEDDDDDSDEEEDSDDESEDDSDEETEEEETEEQNEEGSDHGDNCALCGQGGELLCCDTCPLAYHMECCYPPLRRVPRGNWACQVCSGADEEQASRKRVKQSVIKAALKKSDKKQSPRSAATTSKKPKQAAQVVKTQIRGRQQQTKPKRPSIESSASSRSNSPAPAKATIRIRGRLSVESSSRSPSPAVTARTKTQTTPKVVMPARHVKQCHKILNDVMENEDAWPFLKPVSVTQEPDYSKIITNPVDLNTIKQKLQSRIYSSVEDFTSDMRNIFINCTDFYKPRTKEAKTGLRLSGFFERQLEESGLDISERLTRRHRT